MMSSKPGVVTNLGRVWKRSCLLTRWWPVYRWRELNSGFSVERRNLLINVKRKLQAVDPQGQKYRCDE